MRPACRPTCSKLFYLEAAFIRNAIIVEIIRRSPRAMVTIAMVLCIKLGATAQSVSPAIPNAAAKSASIDRGREDSVLRVPGNLADRVHLGPPGSVAPLNLSGRFRVFSIT